MGTEYFIGFNSIFPLFNRETFNERFERQYSENPPPEIAWYACFNMILAIGSGILSTSPERYDALTEGVAVGFGIDNEDSPAAKYLANATSVYTDLQFGTASLMSVQAVLAMVGPIPRMASLDVTFM